jgi:hypothetical protein
VTGVKKNGKEDTDGEFVKGTDNFKKDTLNYELEPGEKYRIKQNYLNMCLLLTFFNLLKP